MKIGFWLNPLPPIELFVKRSVGSIFKGIGSQRRDTVTTFALDPAL